MTAGRLLVAGLLSTLLVGCQSGGGLARQENSQAEQVRALQKDLVEARQRAVMAEVEAERLTSKVDSLERELREARARVASAPTARDSGQIIDSLPIDSTRDPARAAIEEVELEDPPPAPTTSVTRPTTTPAPSSTPSTPIAASPPSAAPETPPGSGAGPPSGAGAQELYDAAYRLFHEKNYAGAEAAFKRFLTAHPQSHLADNAQFWIGETRWARGDFSSALHAFMATVESYPNGNKVSDALLKAGRCLEALGQKAGAISTYEELEARFPDSAAAISASQRLSELRR